MKDVQENTDRFLQSRRMRTMMSRMSRMNPMMMSTMTHHGTPVYSDTLSPADAVVCSPAPYPITGVD